MAIAVGGTAIAGAQALWSLSRTPLLSGAHARAQSVMTGRGAWVSVIVGVALLMIACILAFVADGVVSGFALLGALLVGAALLLPFVLRVLLQLAEGRAKGVVAAWFWADTRQQLPGLSLALMALLLAMAANVGVSTMVSSFRLTFVEFLDQRLASELYVTTDTAAQAGLFEAYVTPKADAVLPIVLTDVTIQGRATELFGARDHATYRDNWGFLAAADDAWDAVHEGRAILINEQLARGADIGIGDSVQVGANAYDVVGIYGDYGNPIGQAIMGEVSFATQFPDANALRFGVRIAPDQVGDLRQALETELAIRPDAMVNQAAIKAYSLAIFDRTFTVTTALNILTLAVAGFAILMSLLTLTSMRVPQLAPVWAMGLTRGALGRLELVRTVMLAVLTGLLALPLGLALAWVLLAVVNVAAFGWRLPMYVFPWDYAALGGFAVLAAMGAALWPAVRLARTPPADLLKVFANER
jgi:putative ABC transport system permease protein